MHFDVVVEAATTQEEALEYGKHYLASVGQGEQKMTQEECQFCYIREAPPALERDILSKVFLHPKNVRLSTIRTTFVNNLFFGYEQAV